MAQKRNPDPPEICPVCGEDVPPRSLACPECGADHRSGWKESSFESQDLGLPEEDFDYEEFVQKEFETGKKPRNLKTTWWITGIFLILILILYLVV